MAELELRLNVREALQHMGEWEDDLRHGSSRLKIIVSRSINRTIRHMRTLISEELRANYYVKKADVDGSMTVRQAKTGKNQRGSLSFRGNASLPLSQFGARRLNSGVSVKVLRANRARRIQPGGEQKILATWPKLYAAVWIAKGHVMARTEAEPDKPVALYGPSFLSFFSRPNVAKALNIEMGEFFAKRVKAESDFMLGGDKGLVNFGRGQ